MKITRIYNDEAGKSHFGEVEIALKDGGPIGMLSEKLEPIRSFFAKRLQIMILSGIQRRRDNSFSLLKGVLNLRCLTVNATCLEQVTYYC